MESGASSRRLPRHEATVAVCHLWLRRLARWIAYANSVVEERLHPCGYQDGLGSALSYVVAIAFASWGCA